MKTQKDIVKAWAKIELNSSYFFIERNEKVKKYCV
mgnify:CR=1 FL=1